MALDLDDTLLTTDKRFTERTREVLRECMNRDIRVVTASGRFLESQLIFVKNLNLGMEHSPQIGDGGGTIFTEEKLLWRLGKMTKALPARIRPDPDGRGAGGRAQARGQARRQAPEGTDFRNKLSKLWRKLAA